MIEQRALECLLNEALHSERIKDYAPNGLQVEGRSHIKRIVTGVTACQALLDYAVQVDADAVLVHHGYFWANESPVITHLKKQRLATLLRHDINLYAYHLPLDIHPIWGNNAQLADRLGIQLTRGLHPKDSQCVAMVGQLAKPMSGEAFAERIAAALQRPPLHIGHAGLISSVALCSGGGQGYAAQAAEQGIDAFVTGEIAEHCVHTAREMRMHYFAAGHHATERYGVQALGEWLQAAHGLDVIFKDIDNPV